MAGFTLKYEYECMYYNIWVYYTTNYLSNASPTIDIPPNTAYLEYSDINSAWLALL